ncbi:MAG: hypothetical protein AB7V22_02255 [Kiritimatiellia bacterium]
MAFPIWAWAPPHFVWKYVRHLPEGQGTQGVGEMERILRRRGFAVVCRGAAADSDHFLLAANPPTGTEREDALAEGGPAVNLFINKYISGPLEMIRSRGSFGFAAAVFLGKFLRRARRRVRAGARMAPDAPAVRCGPSRLWWRVGQSIWG